MVMEMESVGCGVLSCCQPVVADCVCVDYGFGIFSCLEALVESALFS